MHRIGRTGRLDAHGEALSFFTRNLAPLASDLQQLLEKHEQWVDPNLKSLATEYRKLAKRTGIEEAVLGVAHKMEGGAQGGGAPAAAAPEKAEESDDSSDSGLEGYAPHRRGGDSSDDSDSDSDGE